MSKKKRTYNAEGSAMSLQLDLALQPDKKPSKREEMFEAKRQIFSPELISRLAERIKKL